MNSPPNALTPRTFGVVDLFAGPGGLAEGFSALGRAGHRPFRVRLSVEMEKAAHQTLLLRTFLREFADSFPDEYYDWLNVGDTEPDWRELYPDEFASAEKIAKRLELGNPANTSILHECIDAIRQEYGANTILIGGPPCQAYSLVGRARNLGKAGYDATEDKRHFLYEAYIDVLRRLKPAAFVMENVKGIMSSSVDGQVIFRKILDDLKSEGYRLVALTPPRQSDIASILQRDPEPSDFVVCAEDHGLPQARHRVIVVGLRNDLRKERDFALETMQTADVRANLRHVLCSMPRLRSGLSATLDSPEAWREAVITSARGLLRVVVSDDSEVQGHFQTELRRVIDRLGAPRVNLPRASSSIQPLMKSCPTELADWLADDRLTFLPNHDTRTHMASDLSRYLFAAAFAKATGKSPKASEFPRILAPNHASWHSGKFADRFRVQTYDQPSSTVTCHISKDGHYYIHPDPLQCRSLTVREAARLQTFPDNYFFKGNRTQQYVQVGNAVPPLLAHRIAATLYQILQKPAIRSTEVVSAALVRSDGY